ncbi:hypothetical protein H0H93_008997 [Arthromyces matolae]|nr:hypothetical protein H0H93_008997 [Arthromyces matolae]
MGACLSTVDQEKRAASDAIDKQIEEDAKKFKRECKILLLGSGESGKSTVVKQMKIIHQNGFSQSELEAYRPVVYKNVLDSAQGVLVYMRKLRMDCASLRNAVLADKILAYKLPGIKASSTTHLPATLGQARRRRSQGKALDDVNLDEDDDETQETDVVTRQDDDGPDYDDDEIQEGWFSPEIAEAIHQVCRDPTFQKIMDEHTSNFYLMDSAGYFFSEVLRIGTPGYIPNVTDVLRARRKTFGISEERFKMDTLSWFLRTSIILFLNKIDVFKAKLPKVPLESFFPEYTGGPDINKAAKYVLWRFMHANRARLSVYPHLTQATDTQNIRLDSIVNIPTAHHHTLMRLQLPVILDVYSDMATSTALQNANRSKSSKPYSLKLPGYGLPITFTPTTQRRRSAETETRSLFKNALDIGDITDGYVQLGLTTLREFTMMHFMNQVTDKPNWHIKIFEEEIAAKWKSEALGTPDIDMTEKMVDYCLAELKYKVKFFNKTGAVAVYNGDVVKSDHAVPASLKEALKTAVERLECVPATQKDWHPGSDDIVLDLVHPSLYPLVYGLSRVIPDDLVSLEDCIARCGKGRKIRKPSSRGLPPEFVEGDHATNPYSLRFQWLPCEVDISEGPGNAKITSYINNLHPVQHKDLYAVLEKLIVCIIPQWNMTLTPLAQRGHHTLNPARIQYTRCSYDPDPTTWPETEGPQEANYTDEEGFDEDSYYEARQEWYAANRVVVQPEPAPFEPPKPQDLAVNLWKDYEKSGLQIIVKLANIHLTPEKPEYEGGTWHVEGKLNEHICASAIYYYDSENITTSRLAFRQLCITDTSDIMYEQNHHDWLQAVFGCDPYEPGVQYVGTVDTPEDRVLTWPNILQHQVQPFKLADPTKPGHRKIVALFLVDPNMKIISTANVPCQQREWWSEAIREQGKNMIAKLPLEVQDHVFADVEEFPISLKEAKVLREELMAERRKFVHGHAEMWSNDDGFSLCEH